nr:MAG TPA: hypothetical protein [Caudoviricetes sp.]DAT59147.1 MAG TPA: hypothetical protein [Caudoviricetes sp.]DAV63125.1 MAG TPA: hypothetical protein [Caudoviricetes sp.]
MGCKTPSKNDTLGGVYEPYFFIMWGQTSIKMSSIRPPIRPSNAYF